MHFHYFPYFIKKSLIRPLLIHSMIALFFSIYRYFNYWNSKKKTTFCAFCHATMALINMHNSILMAFSPFMDTSWRTFVTNINLQLRISQHCRKNMAKEVRKRPNFQDHPSHSSVATVIHGSHPSNCKCHGNPVPLQSYDIWEWHPLKYQVAVMGSRFFFKPICISDLLTYAAVRRNTPYQQ